MYRIFAEITSTSHFAKPLRHCFNKSLKFYD